MRRPLSLLLVFLAACASGPARPSSIPQPGLSAQLTNEPFFGSSSTAPANVEVFVTNRANVPITVRHIEVSSPGMTEWAIIPTRRDFQEVIAPGETRSLVVFAIAQTTTRRPREPLTIRAIVDFIAGKDRWRELLIAR